MDAYNKHPVTRYILATAFTITSAAALMLHVVYFRPGPLSLQQKAFCTLLGLLAVYTQLSLRSSYVYYRGMVRSGCTPPPAYPNNIFGIPFLFALAKSLKNNALLQSRVDLYSKFGRTFQARIFPESSSTIFSDEPEAIKTILSTKFEDWVLPVLRIRAMVPILGYHSIFTTNGPEWQHSRAMLRPAFVRDQISDLACFNKHTTKLIQRIPKDGRCFDLQALFSMLTIDTISDFMFGQTTDILGSAPERDVKFMTWFEACLVKVATRGRLGFVSLILPDPELNKYAAFTKSYVDDFVGQRRQTNASGEKGREAQKYVFLDELLKTGEPDEVIRNQLLSVFQAGRDTTSSVLTYLFLELSRRPDVVSKIQEEIQEIGVNDPTWEQLKNMKYINWAVKESLRLNPPVPSNAREAARDTVLPVGGGPDGKSPIFVQKGTMLRYTVWTMQRRKDLFGDDAEEFRPERWENLKVG